MPLNFSNSFTSFNRAACFIALAFSILFAASCGESASQQAAQKSSATPAGNRAPRSAYPMPPTSTASAAEYGWTLLDGRRVKMQDYAGRVVVLDFWATYCPPCREEIPHLIDLQRRYGAQGLDIVGLNVGGPDDRPKVSGFVRDYRIQYTLAYPDPELVNLYLGNNDTIPQTLVFDRKGQLVKHFIGYDQTLPAELEQAIQTSLAAKE